MKRGRKTSSRDLLETIKVLDIPEVKQQPSQQDPAPVVVAVENNAPDDKERKAEPINLSVISEQVSEDDSWAGQSKIRQFVEGSSQF